MAGIRGACQQQMGPSTPANGGHDPARNIEGCPRRLGAAGSRRKPHPSRLAVLVDIRRLKKCGVTKVRAS